MSKKSHLDLEKIAAVQYRAFSGYKAMLMVCTGTGCVSAKGFAILTRLKEILQQKNLDKDYLVVGTGCNGFCAAGPIVVVQPEGIFYQKLKEKDVEEIVESHLLKGQVVERLLHQDPVTGQTNNTMAEIKFFAKQQLIALRNKGLIDPENIDHYIARGGYQSLKKVLEEKNPAGIIKEVIRSGIRGRGGGGFPAGVKWESGYKARKERNEVIYVVCNADEGDPGAYMDRSLVEGNPIPIPLSKACSSVPMPWEAGTAISTSAKSIPWPRSGSTMPLLLPGPTVSWGIIF